jgi:hypothetical protein
MTWSLKHRTRADGRRDRLTVDASGANTRALKMRQKNTRAIRIKPSITRKAAI